MLIQTLRKEVDSDLEKRENHLEANIKKMKNDQVNSSKSNIHKKWISSRDIQGLKNLRQLFQS